MRPGSSAIAAARRRADALARVLATHDRLDRGEALARDPVRFVRRFALTADRELAALLCALLAFGRVETIGQKLEALFALLGPSPSRTIRELGPARLDARLAHFRHRTFRGDDIAALLAACGVVLARDGSLYAPLGRAFARGGTLRLALADFADELRALAWPSGRVPRSARHLLPDPRGPSACKRLALLARWIARPDDGVDLGLCTALPTRALVMPLDVHVHRVARELGFTQRRGASWLAALEVTEALRGLDADDPVRFDFAVCHTAIAEHRVRLRSAPRRDTPPATRT